MDIEVLAYLWTLVPILVAVLTAHRYNFILGFSTFFMTTYVMYFIVTQTSVIRPEMAVSSGILDACNFMYSSTILPFRSVFMYVVEWAGLNNVDFFNQLIATGYGYLVIFISLQIMLQIFSSAYRAKKVRELRQLRKSY